MRIGALVLVTALAATTRADAQRLETTHGPGHYGAFGLGMGKMELTCDSCGAGSRSASDLSLTLGRKIDGRMRIELGARIMRHSESSSTLTTFSGGLGMYLVNNLFVRGGATYLRADIADSNQTFEGSGGPGFYVGAGYELFLGREFALTPYVNYATGKISSLDRSVGSTLSGAMAGTITSLNFGLSIGRSARSGRVCVNQAGQRVRQNRSNMAPYRACFSEVVARYERERNESMLRILNRERAKQ